MLKEFTNPGATRGSQHSHHSQPTGSSEFQRSCWDFTGVRKLAVLNSSDIYEVGAVIEHELKPHRKMQLPEIGKLSLEAINQHDATRRQKGIQIILDEPDNQNNLFQEPDSAGVFESSQKDRMATPPKTRNYEEAKLNIHQHTLGRPSFSDNTAGSKQRDKL